LKDEENYMARGETRKIRVTRSILLKGEHTERGTVLEVSVPLANSLVGDGSAEYHEDSADEVAAENAAGVKVHEPHAQNADPIVRKVSDPRAAPKAQKA
jgi:hypothetical protein